MECKPPFGLPLGWTIQKVILKPMQRQIVDLDVPTTTKTEKKKKMGVVRTFQYLQWCTIKFGSERWRAQRYSHILTISLSQWPFHVHSNFLLINSCWDLFEMANPFYIYINFKNLLLWLAMMNHKFSYKWFNGLYIKLQQMDTVFSTYPAKHCEESMC